MSDQVAVMEASPRLKGGVEASCQSSSRDQRASHQPPSTDTPERWSTRVGSTRWKPPASTRCSR